MLQALCASDSGIKQCLRRRRCQCRQHDSSSSSTRRPPCFSLSSLSSLFSLSVALVSRRVCLCGPSRCNAASSTTHSRCQRTAPLAPDAAVRACIHLRLTTDHAGRPRAAPRTDPTRRPSVRPLRSSHVRQHATVEPDTTEMTSRAGAPARVLWRRRRGKFAFGPTTTAEKRRGGTAPLRASVGRYARQSRVGRRRSPVLSSHLRGFVVVTVVVAYLQRAREHHRQSTADDTATSRGACILRQHDRDKQT